MDNVKADATRLLMSDVLKGNVADVEDQVEQLGLMTTYVIIDRVVDNEMVPFSGTMRGIVFSDRIEEVELRIGLDDATDILEKGTFRIASVLIQVGESDIRTFKGPYYTNKIRIDEIDAPSQLCVLGLQLGQVFDATI